MFPEVNLVSTSARRRAGQGRPARHLLGAEPESAIVGCEPSCLFTLRDESIALLPDDARAQDVARRVRQVEELLTESIDDGRLRLRTDSWLAGRRILFHGHCHQKPRSAPPRRWLCCAVFPAWRWSSWDAGCWGMAGSFGFESEHFDLSTAVGSDRLFLAIAAEPAETVLAATGVSCRQQIFHGASRTGWHPVELVGAAIANS
jgi:Fe-S oxidoreductase